jgi:hypothetical protein
MPPQLTASISPQLLGSNPYAVTSSVSPTSLTPSFSGGLNSGVYSPQQQYNPMQAMQPSYSTQLIMGKWMKSTRFTIMGNDRGFRVTEFFFRVWNWAEWTTDGVE